jgi:GNAT superfamily N-acetyltransferase
MEKIVRSDNRNADFLVLIGQLDADLAGRYHELQKQYDAYNLLPDIDTVVLIYNEGIAAACGCFKKMDETSAELKRMFVKPEYRRKGYAKLILNELEKWATELGFEKMVLETGKKQPEAIGLYTASGYRIISNFGQYQGNDNSVCMKKQLC